MQKSRIGDGNIWVIYTAILLLGVAYGVSIAVLAIHLSAHGIPAVEMGILAACFALGIITFSLPAGWIVSRIGAKKTLLVALGGYAACVAAFPFLPTLYALGCGRFFDGAFSVGVWVAAETALLSRSNATNKAFVMSLYAMSLAIGYVLGPLLASAVVPFGGTSATFLAAGILALVAAAIVFVFFERTTKVAASTPGDGPYRAAHDPAPADEAPKTPALGVLWRTKTSCFATFSYGYFQSSVVLFLPLYLIAAKGVPQERTILITAFFAAGMLVASTSVSRLGDRHGHLLVMRVLATIGGTMVASFVFLPSFWMMCVAVFVAGATLASISPVSLALQGVVIEARDLGRANGFYNAAYAAGMLIGPPLSSVLVSHMGGAWMLLHLAVLWAAFVTFTVVFAADDPRSRKGLDKLAAGALDGSMRSSDEERAIVR